MPIQISYTQKRRTVKVLSAGEPQYLLCPDSLITLTAVINDITNLKNHTLTWEQQTGPNVQLTGTNQLVATFPFSDTEDKIFRFYLDKGTNKEQYKDVFIYYTPTTNAGKRVFGHKKLTWESTLPNKTTSTSFITPAFDGSINDNVPVLPAVKYDFGLTSLSGLVGTQKGMDVFTSSAWVVNPSTLYASYGVDDFPTSLILPNGVYIIRVYYEVNGNLITIDSPLLVVKGIDIGGIRVIQDIFKNNIANIETSNFVRRTFKQFTGTSTFNPISVINIKNTTGLIRYTPKKADIDQYPNLMSSAIMNISNTATSGLVRLDPSNIGNN